MTLSYNPRQKSLRQYCNIHIFLSFLGSLLKQCILFEIFLQFSLPNPIQSWNSEKNSGCTRPTWFVGWGEGLDLCELENAPETQKCPKTFVHDFTCSVIRELKATVKQTRNTCNFAAKWVEEQRRTFHHTCSTCLTIVARHMNMTFDWIKLRGSHDKHVGYNTSWKTSLP